MSTPETDDIGFDDVPPSIAPSDPLSHLPSDLRSQAAKLPRDKAYTVLSLKEEGDGHNASLLAVAATCFRMDVSYDDTLDHLQAAYSPDRMDYETAPRRAVARVWAAEGDLGKLTDSDAEAAPDEKEEYLLRFRRTPTTAIIEQSPPRLSIKPVEIINRLFQPDQIINIQHTALEYGTLVKASDLPKFLEKNKSTIDDFKFINPAHFKKVEGVPNPLHPKKKVSTRCNENVKARPWVVLEMDSKDESRLERFNTFVMAMAGFAPLVLAVDTGNKSIHFWFDATDVKPKTRSAFFALACLHGADKRMGVKSQIARMPNVTAADVGRGPQKVIYYDPDGGQSNNWDIRGFEKFLQQNKQLDYYYHGKTGRYMTRDNLESWVSLDRTSLRSHLSQKGFRDQKADGELIAPMDEVINAIQLDKNIEAVVPGASGRHAGVYEENGHRVIVTKSPTLIKPRRGEWPNIANFLIGLLGHQRDQTEVFYGWLADSVKKLRNDGKRRAVWGPCQMLHVIGPPNAGKSLLLKDILTPCFAGRNASADPLFKKSPDMHNPDTFACELLFLDDTSILETNHHFRQEHGERIKNHVVGVGGGMRDMHQGRLNIRPWWRFVRLMNTEPTTLATLPPLDDGVEDKLIFLRGEDMQQGPLANEMKLPGWYDRLQYRIETELPAFLHFLLYEFELPKHLRDPKQRFPTISYKEPRILADISEGSSEANLLYKMDHDACNELFGAGMFADDEPTELSCWTGSADALYEILSACGSRANQIRFSKFCPSPRVMISQLRALEKHNPERVGYSRRLDDWANKKNSKEYWVLFPADYDDTDYETTNLEDLL